MTKILKTQGAKATRIMLSCLLVMSACLGVFANIGTQKAYATDTYLSVGGNIPYAGYGTSLMYSGESIAYCGNPSAATPAAGAYAKADIDAPSGRNAETAADLWFGYGAPGFDANMWPATWYDGSPMTDGNYIALTHVLLSDTFSSDGNYALHGCNQAFKDWARYNIIGFGDDGEMINGGATGRQMAERADEVPSNFMPYMLYTGAATQLILSFDYIPDGYVQVHKDTADASISAGNPNYSLAGAEYTVYDGSGAPVCVLATDASGLTNVSGALPVGSYTCKETKAPAGFALDEQTYSFAIAPENWDANRVVALTPAPELPQTGTDRGALTVTLNKGDLETSEQSAQGAATLEGAKFVVKHYALAAGSVSDASALANQTPDYTWTVITGADGSAVIEAWTSNDDNEVHGLPLGVCTIEETEAPTGYLLDKTVRVFDVVASGATQHFDLANVPVVSNQVIRGDIELIKISDGDHKRMAGVPFAITSKTTGEVHTIVTDANGYASTTASWNSHALDTNGDTAGSGIWFGTSTPDDGHGALIYDTYSVEEQPCEANAGKTLIPAFEITLSRDAHVINLGTLTNDSLPKASISKADITTGEELPGATLQVIDKDGKVIEEWVSTDTAHEVLLPAGEYALHEELAPDGYLVAGDVAFTVLDGTITQNVEMKDDYTKVDISKTDIATGKELPGAHLQVIDNDDAVVAEWDTDGTTHRIDKLAPGDYILRETSAPDGYEVAEDVAFTVEAAGDIQLVEMKDKATPETPEKPVEPTTPDTPTSSDLPKTGDSFPWAIIAVFVLAGAGATTGAYALRRKRTEETTEPEAGDRQ